MRVAAEGQDPAIVAQIQNMILDYISKPNVSVAGRCGEAWGQRGVGPLLARWDSAACEVFSPRTWALLGVWLY